MGKHIESNHKPKCTTCEKVFSSSEELQGHIAAEHGDGNSCNFCEKTFPNKLALKEHIQVKHKFFLVAQLYKPLSSSVGPSQFAFLAFRRFVHYYPCLNAWLAFYTLPMPTRTRPCIRPCFFLRRQSYVESRDASILVHSCYPEGEMDEEMDEILSPKCPTEVSHILIE